MHIIFVSAISSHYHMNLTADTYLTLEFKLTDTVSAIGIEVAYTVSAVNDCQ